MGSATRRPQHPNTAAFVGRRLATVEEAAKVLADLKSIKGRGGSLEAFQKPVQETVDAREYAKYKRVVRQPMSLREIEEKLHTRRA